MFHPCLCKALGSVYLTRLVIASWDSTSPAMMAGKTLRGRISCLCRVDGVQSMFTEVTEVHFLDVVFESVSFKTSLYFICLCSGSGPSRQHSDTLTKCPCFEPFWQFFCTVSSFTFRNRFTVLILLPVSADQQNSLYYDYGVNRALKIPWMRLECLAFESLHGQVTTVNNTVTSC